MKITLITYFLVIIPALNAQEAAKSNTNYFTDDNMHYLAGHGIAAGVGYSMHFFTNRPVLSCLAGFLTGTAIGVGKEYIYDKELNKGTFSVGDMATTAWGSLTGSLMLRVVIDVENRHNKKSFLFKQTAKEDVFKELYAFNN